VRTVSKEQAHQRDIRAAWHEAGHTTAVLYVAPRWFLETSIVPNETSGGRTMHEGLTLQGLQALCRKLSPTDGLRFIRFQVNIAIGGFLGQEQNGQEPSENEFAHDIGEIMKVVIGTQRIRGVPASEEDEDFNSFIDHAQVEMRAILLREQRLMQHLVEDLLSHRTLTRPHVLALYRRHWQGIPQSTE
jgi:ATP-dependent Zn protease